MISLEKALGIVRAVSPRAAEETVPLGRALGRVLARPLSCPFDSPPFDKSAMDGFAVAAADRSPSFRIVETVAAGAGAPRRVAPGECARIMTGAMLPEGAGRVIRKEYVEEAAGAIRVVQEETVDNVVRRGANVRAGDVILTPRPLSPQDIGVAAASGFGELPVRIPPVVGILATGSELRSPGEPLGPGEIYNSNGPQLAAQLSAMAVPSRLLGLVPDQPGPLGAAVAAALESCDVVLLTGGVSEGDFDYVPRCLAALGAEILFHKVEIKPGKPTLFARRAGRHLFGLPGNPVSAFVIFEVFVKPFLYRLMGCPWDPPRLTGRLGREVRRRTTERDEFLPVRMENGEVIPLSYHGSAHLNALSDAHGLIMVPKGVAAVLRGEAVDVRPL
jgi:molybdopterin molybdotransferase